MVDASRAAATIHAAERLVAELAAELRFVPIDGAGLRAHLRALELKREIRSWCEHTPPEKIAAVTNETRELLEEVRTIRRSLTRSSRRTTEGPGHCAARRSMARTFVSARPIAGVKMK